MKYFTIRTLGCKVNQSESDALAAVLHDQGMLAVEENPAADEKTTQADVCIVNTCTVTERASTQSRQAIRQLIRQYPNAKIVVTGCYAQTQPEEIRKIPGVHLVVGREEKHRIPLLLADPAAPARDTTAPRWAVPAPAPCADHAGGAFEPRTRAFLKIQDGCNACCTYCIVPRARGRSRSMPPQQVAAALTRLGQKGYREVVLSGIHLGCYGLDLAPATSLLDLVRHIDDLGPVDRIRLSSIEPAEISDALIALVAGARRLCPHFHIPLQSGHDGILKKMNRPYSSADFERLVDRIHKALPEAAIGADVMVGFPGEHQEAFEATCALIRRLPLTYLHVFPFSPRKTTPAWGFSDQVAPAVSKQRAAVLREIGNRKREAFYDAFIGKTVAVLIEDDHPDTSGLVRARAANYLPVLLENAAGRKNTMATVHVDRRLGSRGVLATAL